MERDIRDYAEILGQPVIDELFFLGEKLQGKSVQNINSTAVGGGVAELLTRIVPFMNQLGVNARWDVIKGDEKFFHITKKMHNALHGVEIQISKEERQYFLDVNRENAKQMDLAADIFVIHDPQPAPLVEKRAKTGGDWIWRCHIDLTAPREDIIGFLRRHISRYDAVVFSAPAFSHDFGVPQFLISPSIDPFSDKNRDLPVEKIDSVAKQFGLDRDRPIITQISRFDYLKDPIGVIEAYKKVKRHNDCQLVLAGGGAIDDPEGLKVLEEVRNHAEQDSDIHVIFLPPLSDIEINALQRLSTIVVQKSLREGFGLTVSEALWKEKPVIASAVGGIPLQIIHKYSGILVHSIEGTAYYLKQLLNEPEYARELGKNGHEQVKNDFLITRNIRHYLLLFLSLFHKDEDIIYL